MHLEEIQDIRHRFAEAIISPTRVGKVKIIYDHFLKLRQIWGRSPNINLWLMVLIRILSI